MRRSNLLVVAVLVLVGVSLSPKAYAFVQERDWAYVQSIGGLKLGQPVQKDGNWTMPVTVDVTGATTVTVAPTAHDPALVCAGIQAEIHDQDIYLSLFTSHPWLGAGKGGCPPVVLGHLAPGSYVLYYRGLDDQPLKLAGLEVK